MLNPKSCWSIILVTLACLMPKFSTSSFVLQQSKRGAADFKCRSQFSTTKLNAIGVLAKKAKELELRKYVEAGIPSSVMEKIQQMKDDSTNTFSTTMGPVQKALTKRKGTIAVIAEYKRKLTDPEMSGFIAEEPLEPKILGKTFREFGASVVAVMTDKRLGGCTYEDLTSIREEQEAAKGDVPGPLYVISSDLVVDELQLAMAAAAGAHAVVLTLGVLGEEKCRELMSKARSIGLESIVSIATTQEAQRAIDIGGRIILVNAFAATDKIEMVMNTLVEPDGEAICKIASIVARDNKQLEEVEEAWVLRDAGFQAVWAGDCLYKSGNDPSEHAGAIIRSMIAKSSVKWASAKARGGKGEGAREYLGDLLM
jgi:indole-3-glycerol phosphate synthase